MEKLKEKIIPENEEKANEMPGEKNVQRYGRTEEKGRIFPCG